MRLVADVGGTNARLALCKSGAIVEDTVQSFRNDTFGSFLDLAQHFVDQCGTPNLTEAVVAVAGPVWGSTAKLTNRDWFFDADAISAGLNVQNVELINDLTALGHALPALRTGQTLPLLSAPKSSARQTQSLVIGIGTGFNVCPVIHLNDRVECLEVEYGHASLPSNVVTAAQPVLGDVTDIFPTVEECFSGRGYKITLERGGTPEFFADLMAELSRDLVMSFMPRCGLYFNGGVARSVLTSAGLGRFVDTFQRPFELAPDLRVPVALINDDTAALIGCARVVI